MKKGGVVEKKEHGDVMGGREKVANRERGGGRRRWEREDPEEREEGMGRRWRRRVNRR